jgi:acyl-CoA synthetase (AMP-forming)/AMP-acid ligase II
MQLASYTTLTEAVIRRAAETPEARSVIFLHDDGAEHIIRAAEFHARNLAYAGALRQLRVGPEDLVILVLKHSETLLSAFWGAMYLGAIASIFPFLTEKLDPDLYKERVKALVTQEQARAVITFPEFKDEISALLADTGCRVLSSEEAAYAEPVDGNQASISPAADGEKIAFLQHSSGTTGLQKGVALSHRAVLNQVRAYSASIDLRADDVVISWLPLYHDMGLIAGFVMPLVAGVPLVLMSPFAWVRSPKLLLQAASAHRATLTWLPNFAYNHSVRGIRERDLEGVDLSSLRAVINCSEPVRHDSQQAFLQRFAPYGLQESALSACYAMAENTFAVTQTPTGQPPRVDWVLTGVLQGQKRAEPVGPGGLTPAAADGATPMVSCGLPIPGTEVRIVDEQRQPLPERQVGEVALRSNCMLSGYYHRADATAEAIHAGWYFTGDMGYVADGELYISGRKKDMIIVGGKNVFPQDLEAIATGVPGLYPGRSVAFGVLDARMGSEAIVMVCELEDDAAGEEARSAIERELRQRIVQQTEIALSDVLLVGHRWLIKTSSGKIARGDNRQKYLDAKAAPGAG